MTATVTVPETSTSWEPRSAPEGARWSLNEITGRSAELLPGTTKRQVERAKGLAYLLEWLGTFPGDNWQQRWIAAGCDQAGTSWGQQDLIPYRKSLQGSALIALVVLGVVRPSMLWLRTATPPHMFITYRSVVDSETFALLDEKLSTFRLSKTSKMLALNAMTLLRIRAGVPLLSVTASQFLRAEAEWKALRRTRSVGVVWQALQACGALSGEPADYRALQLEGRRTVPQVVDTYGVSNPRIRSLLIDYLTERAAALDYSSLAGLTRMLVRNFWTDIERHHPGQDTIRLPHDTATAWKQRLRYLSGGRERRDYFAHLTAVRAFYTDLAQWAITEPERWAL
jgi:hypothetical protein